MSEDLRSNPEYRLRERELEVREREVKVKEREQSRWLRNPVFVGLIAATLGLLGNATVAWFQNRNTEELERKKFQYQLLVEATRTNDPKVAAKRLSLLLRLGLIDDPDGRITSLSVDPNAIPLTAPWNIPDKPPQNPPGGGDKPP